MGQSKTSKYYAENPTAAEKRRESQRKINKKAGMSEYRSLLNKANRKAGTYGNGDGFDMSHTRDGKLVKEKATKNRSRNGANGKSTKK
jgi:hypothetical protein